jgi:hypothetical protein
LAWILTVLRIRDVYPGSRIQKQQQKRGVKKNYLIFEILKKKIWAIFKRIIELFTQKISQCSQNKGFGSGIRKKSIPDPGSRGQRGTGSGSATLDTDPLIHTTGLRLISCLLVEGSGPENLRILWLTQPLLILITYIFAVLRIRDPGLGAFLTPGSGMGENQHPDPGSGMNNPDHIFRA